MPRPYDPDFIGAEHLDLDTVDFETQDAILAVREERARIALRTLYGEDA